MSLHADELIRDLTCRTWQLRIKVIEMLAESQSGHPGGSLSAADFMAALYFHQLRLDPKNPSWPDRDRFVLSKGHAAPVWYAALASAGFFPEKELMTLRKLGSMLQGHPERTRTPGIDMSSGPLGQGLSVGIGMAMGARLQNRPFRTYVMIGDGESNEGQIWEAAMAAPKFALDNLTAILDFNEVQLDGMCCEIMPLEPVADKWRAFGWNVIEIDGHNMQAVLDSLDLATTVKGRPTIILAHTTKGKGVSYMEGKSAYHGKVLTKEESDQGLAELRDHLAKAQAC